MPYCNSRRVYGHGPCLNFAKTSVARLEILLDLQRAIPGHKQCARFSRLQQKSGIDPKTVPILDALGKGSSLRHFRNLTPAAPRINAMYPASVDHLDKRQECRTAKEQYWVRSRSSKPRTHFSRSPILVDGTRRTEVQVGRLKRRSQVTTRSTPLLSFAISWQTR